jgi:hypothetical protein
MLTYSIKKTDNKFQYMYVYGCVRGRHNILLCKIPKKEMYNILCSTNTNKNITLWYLIGIYLMTSVAKIVYQPVVGKSLNKQKTSVSWVHELTIPNERPPFVDEVNANYCG